MTTPSVQYVEGQRVIIEGVFRLEGVPTDPTLVRCYARAPSGAVEELVYPSTDLVRTDPGTYEATVTATEPGTWGFRMVGAGNVEAVREVTTTVLPSAVLH